MDATQPKRVESDLAACRRESLRRGHLIRDLKGRVPGRGDNKARPLKQDCALRV